MTQTFEPLEGGEPPKSPIYRNPFVVAVAALLIGILIGVLASPSDPGPSHDYQSLQTRYETLEAQSKLDKSELADLRARSNDLDDLEADLTAREAELDAQDAKTAKTNAAKKKAAEAKIIPGDGTYEVGKDVKAGTYKNAGAISGDGYVCVGYTSRKPSDLGSYIAGSTNKGPGIVTLHDGEYFTSQFCQDWKRQ